MTFWLSLPFLCILPKSENVKRSLLNQGYDTAVRSIRGEPNEVYPQCYKNTSDRDKFDRKWNAAKHLFLSRSPFHRASNDQFINYVNNFGMTPEKFRDKTGVENSVLFRELKGQRKLSIDKAITYAKALGVEVRTPTASLREAGLGNKNSYLIFS